MKDLVYCSMSRLRMATVVFALLVLSTACSEAEKPASKPAVPVSISGSMTGEDGPVKEAKLTATDRNGEVIATVEVNSGPRYRIELPAGVAYPVIISALYPRSTKVVESGQGEIKAAIMKASSSTVELSPKSTSIVDIAMARGGLTPENFKSASLAILNQGSGGSGGMPYQGGH
ncbi:conserved hypothetical protein [Nitrosococcus halophilus Nc 4]|uniref:Carboxypeptidase regulatory-like domain-containing protein n=1 Tax=Nitrosococcus halophilus (strain Nc4) TaxID=472759 RepID=D5BX65_NITHN|nr:hypothetical protein [Nitrosococcus halophilus]ADE15748.1 conserved hypothetical protein [Nitrosococcus halophilus Nc 4]